MVEWQPIKAKLFWPILLILLFFGLAILHNIFSIKLISILGFNYYQFLYKLIWMAIFLSFLWFFNNVVTNIKIMINQYLLRREQYSLSLIVDFSQNALKILIFLLLFSLALNRFDLPYEYRYITEKITALFFIWALVVVSIKFAQVIEDLILHRYSITQENINTTIQTQIIIIKRLVLGMIYTIGVGASLLIFAPVRELGAGILASAGIISLLANKPINHFIMGLQIAFSQPIKLNDNVIVENEFSWVEEINLYYVVLRVWDLRRMIMPIQYFIENPFQNLSRSSNNIIGEIHLFVDYALHLNQLRTQLTLILEESTLWNHQVANVLVFDLREKCMDIQILVSANNAVELGTLKAYVREQMVLWIQQNYPKCFPKTRLENL